MAENKQPQRSDIEETGRPSRRLEGGDRPRRASLLELRRENAEDERARRNEKARILREKNRARARR